MSRFLPAAASGLACLLLLAGCGGDGGARTDRDRERHDRDRERPRAAARPATPEQRSATPAAPRTGQRRAQVPDEPAAPDPGRNALTVERGGGSGHLLRAGDLGRGWRVSATGPEDGRLLSRCQAASLFDIGAERTRLRDFSTGGRAAAGQAVSRFVDPKSAWRAEQVLLAWRDDCTRQLRRRDAALGTVRHGAWVSVVEISGVDAPERDLRAALRRVAATFS